MPRGISRKVSGCEMRNNPVQQLQSPYRCQENGRHQVSAPKKVKTIFPKVRKMVSEFFANSKL
jgi:hypothetical protein